MSSTISQPTAMRPRSVSMMRRSCNARASTTVLATDRASPNTTPPPIDQPNTWANPMPSSVPIAMRSSAPGTAMARTSISSLSEKCRPTANISRITPISASWLASACSATKPGVNGPTTTPASR